MTHPRTLIPCCARPGRWVMPLLAGLLLAVPAAAQDGRDGQSDGTGAVDPGQPSLLDEFRLLPATFVHSFSSPRTWDEAAWTAFPSWVGGIAGISLMDEWARELADRPLPDAAHAVLDFVEPLGMEASFGVLGGFYAAGLVLDDRRARSVALEGLAASVLAGGIITPVLQRVVGRKRPRHSPDTHDFEPFSGHIGFPSGHVTQAFAVASVIATEYDSGWVDAAAYGLAGGVALHRLVNDAHHLSDVTAGALIGTVVGRCIASFGQEHRRAVRVQPFSEAGMEDGTAVGLSVVF